MQIAVVGAGAIGAVVADAASASGHEVTVCHRGGLDALSIDGRRLPVQLVGDPRSVGPVDLVFFTVKAVDTAGAAPWLEALAGPATLVAVVQNGLDQADRVRPLIGPEVAACPVLAYIGAERVSPGQVRHFDGRTLVVPAEHAPRIGAAVGARLEVKGRDDMVTACWQKLLGNVIANPLTALTMRRIDVIGEPGMAELARGLLREAIAVGRAEGARLNDELVELMVAGTSQYGPETGSSMLYDRIAGRPTEHQFITGEVVRRGGAHGIATPLNSAVLALLDAIDHGREAAGSQVTTL